MTAVLYATLCTAAYYLMSRAKVTRWLWSRYPPTIEYWTLCAACSGFWYGLGCAGLGAHFDWPFLGLTPDAWYTFLIVGLCTMVWTPILAFVMTYSWDRLLPDEGTAEPTPLHVVEDA